MRKGADISVKPANLADFIESLLKKREFSFLNGKMGSQRNKNLLSEMLNKRIMQSSYLDSFNLDLQKLPKVSAIIPTFNRCPHPVSEDSNPLAWAIESLLAQRGNSLDEIILIDDDSVDYTPEVVDHFQRISRIPIVYLKNPENRGSSISRNLGVEESRNDHVLFLDDDCVFSRHMVFGASYTLGSLDDSVAALHLPVYHRKTIPDSVDLDKIGVLDLDKGIVTSNYGGFPVQFTEDLESNLLDSELGVVRPFEVGNLGGIFLARKEAFQEVGGFPETLTWKNGYREETDVAIKFADAGYRIFFTPDPKFYCVHLKYGASGERDQCLNEESGLKRLVDESGIRREETGNRVDTKEWFFSYLISTYVMVGRKNPVAAARYRSQMEREFVIDNSLRVTGVGGKIDELNDRRRIFENAMSEGDRVIGGGV